MKLTSIMLASLMFATLSYAEERLPPIEAFPYEPCAAFEGRECRYADGQIFQNGNGDTFPFKGDPEAELKAKAVRGAGRWCLSGNAVRVSQWLTVGRGPGYRSFQAKFQCLPR